MGVFRVALSSKTIYCLARASSPVEVSQIRVEVTRILASLPNSSKRKPISVRQFKGTGSPFVSWLTGDTIFVPESFLTWSESEQSVSLAHEIGHLQRRDHYCRLITQFAFCLTWLHPLAWILHRQTVLAQELAADQVAAQTTENSSAYCRGLSRLALRFDAECRHPSALGVSVSSSLIRRITMLREINFYRLPCSRFVNRCITLSAFIACTWIGCWSVSAQSAIQEQQTDPQVVAASHTAPVKTFSAPVTEPWEVIGNQPGYIKVRVSRLLDHPDFKSYEPMITTQLDSLLRSEANATPSIKQFGLALDEITHIQGGLLVSYSHNAKKPVGQRNSINIGMSTAEVFAANTVDWPKLINAFDFEKLRTGIAADHRTNGPSDLELVREAWLKSSEKGRSKVFGTDLLWKQSFNKAQKTELSETQKTVWKAVSGGVVTLICDIDRPETVPEDYEDEDPLGQAILDMQLAFNTVAVGMDLSQDNQTSYLRLAAVPKAGVSASDLLKKFEAVQDACDPASAGDDDFSKYLLEQFKNAKATVVKSRSAGKKTDTKTLESYLLIEGESLGNPLNLLLSL